MRHQIPRTRALGAALWVAAALACSGGGDANGYRIYWERVEPMGTLVGGRVMPAAAGDSAILRVERNAGDPATVPLLVLRPTVLVSPYYDLTGEIRHRDVEGVAFLEMWSIFSDGSRYFTRTLSEAGPTAGLRGDSDWRRVELPFRGNAEMGMPSRLELNAVLPGEGVVEIGPLRLVEYRDPAWWDPREAAVVAIGAAVVTGLFWMVFAVLAAQLRAPRFVGAAPGTTLVLGVLLIVVAAAAALNVQPYHVIYPILLAGGVNTVLATALLLLQRRVSGLVG